MDSPLFYLSFRIHSIWHLINPIAEPQLSLESNEIRPTTADEKSRHYSRSFFDEWAFILSSKWWRIL